MRAIALSLCVVAMTTSHWASGAGAAATQPPHGPAGVKVLPVKGSAGATPVLWKAPECYRGKVVKGRRHGFPTKIVAMTFDDGPTRQITPQILAILKQHSVHATFFILGQQVKHYPQLVHQIVAEGHAIGFHSYTHSRWPSLPQAEREMSACEALLRKIAGARTSLFRPPYGKTTSNHVRVALQRGYTVLTWTNDDSDSRTKNPGAVERSVLNNLKSGDIVLMHDNATKHQTIAALPVVLDTMAREGYRFLTVPEMLDAWRDRDQAASASRAARSAHAGRPSRMPHTTRAALSVVRHT